MNVPSRVPLAVVSPAQSAAVACGRWPLGQWDVSTPMTGGGRLISAGRAHFSWNDLDWLLAAAIGESPAALRRRLLLERPAWQLAHGYTTTDVEAGAGYRPTAAFPRVFARAHGSPPSRHSGPFVITGYHPLLSWPEAVADLVLRLPG